VNYIASARASNVQDGSVLHVTRPYRAATPAGRSLIGDDVVIAHNVTVHGCTIGTGCWSASVRWCSTAGSPRTTS